MRLCALLSALSPVPASLSAGEDPIVRGISYDSRAVAAGDVFVALRGSLVDGHAYLAQAIALGAVAIVVEEIPSGLDLRGRPAIVVADTRRALAALATRFYGEPSAELALIGVTGTNGKTSTTYLIEAILGRAGRRVGLIGTLEARFGGQRRRSINTTPESLDLQMVLRDMRNRGADAVVMEVSSHGLQLGRVDGCRFSVGAFTNLTQDHLDFHGTMAAYRDAKALLFTHYLAKGGCAVVNVDDPAGPELALAARRRAGDPRLPFSRRGGATRDGRRAHGRDAGACRASRRPPRAGDSAAGRLQRRERARRLRRRQGARRGDGVDRGRRRRLPAGAGPRRARRQRRRRAADGADRLRPYARRRRQAAAHAAAAHARAVDHAVRLRRRPRPPEAPADGRGGRTLERPGRGDQRQPAQRGSARDPRRRRRGSQARTRGAGASARPSTLTVVVDRRSAIRSRSASRPDDSCLWQAEDYQIVGRERLPFDDREEARRALVQRGAR
jgi:hypothetical protein